MKKIYNILKLGGILLIICIIIAISVTFINQITDPIIKLKEENIKKISFEKLFPKANKFINITNSSTNNLFPCIIEIYQAKEINRIAGYLYIVSTLGYSDKIKNLIAIDSKQNKIKSINILYQNETPGLGDQVTKDKFKNQYSNINVHSLLTIVKTKPNIKNSEIQAITSSTITSKAVNSGVNIVLSHYNKFFKNIGE